MQAQRHIAALERGHILDERGVRQPQAVGQVLALQVHAPRRAVDGFVHTQVQHTVATGAGFIGGGARLAGHLHPLGLPFPAVPAGVQPHTDTGRRNARQRAAAIGQLGAHHIPPQAKAQVPAQRLAHRGFQAGETRIALAVLQQLQAVVLIQRLAVDVALNAVVVAIELPRRAPRRLAQAQLQRLAGFLLQVRVALFQRAGGHVQAVGVQLFGRGHALGAAERGAGLVARRKAPHGPHRGRGAVVLALLCRMLRLHALAVVAQRGLKAPVAQGVFLQQEQAQAAGVGGLHVGFLTIGAELALPSAQAPHAAPTGQGGVLHLHPHIVGPVAKAGGDGIALDLIVPIAGVAGPQAHGFDALQRRVPLPAHIPAVAGHVHHGHAVVMVVIVIVVVMVIVVSMAMAAAMQVHVRAQPVGMAVLKSMRVAGQPVLGLLAGVGQAQVAGAANPRQANAAGVRLVEAAVHLAPARPAGTHAVIPRAAAGPFHAQGQRPLASG